MGPAYRVAAAGEARHWRDLGTPAAGVRPSMGEHVDWRSRFFGLRGSESKGKV